MTGLIENTLYRNGCPLHYWTCGKANAPLVVFTHGATIDHHEWDATLPLVEAAGFRVLAWDMRGHGLSRPASFDFIEARADLLALLDTLGVKQTILVGHSMGGNLHQEVVFHHPERVRALVMLDCTWNFKQLNASDKFWLKLADPIFKLYPYKTLIDQSVAVTATSTESQALLRKSMQLLSKEEYVHILMGASLCLRYEPEYKITQPLLLMIGDKEATGNIRKAMPLWAKHEGIELVVIPHARHAANLDQPEIFHKYLLDFLHANS
ncbi:MAG: alpha/beta hydrolase [Anaerolineales bacterium]|jgi:pimeloyl-ACP methyl ester carboxylesterase